MTSLNNSGDFDRWASSYDDDVTEDGQFPFDGYTRVLERMRELTEQAPVTTVLELGVGTGNLSRQLVDAGAELWGVDFSAEMLAAAHTKLPNAHLFQANLLEPLPAPLNRRFPVVVSAYVFHEFGSADKMGLLQRIMDDHLLPGGRIIVGDIGFADLDARDNARAVAGDRWDEEYYWSVAEAVGLAEQLQVNLDLEAISSCAYIFTFKDSTTQPT